jgi:hypothetical protein
MATLVGMEGNTIGESKVAYQLSGIIWIIIDKTVPKCGSRNLNFLS